MTQKNDKATPKEIPWFAIGVIGTCCLIPLMPILFAVGGAWVSSLTSMETLRLVFLIPALVFIGFGYRKLYLLSDSCNESQSSISDEVKTKQRMVFWISSVLILLILLFF
jgi:mercuric ion transport protein